VGEEPNKEAYKGVFDRNEGDPKERDADSSAWWLNNPFREETHPWIDLCYIRSSKREKDEVDM